jgi:D-3-phosphoglycerate dehydrogenase
MCKGKTLGIVGYGHIGAQLSVLADSLGIHVAFFDSQSLFPLGSGVYPIN